MNYRPPKSRCCSGCSVNMDRIGVCRNARKGINILLAENMPPLSPISNGKSKWCLLTCSTHCSGTVQCCCSAGKPLMCKCHFRLCTTPPTRSHRHSAMPSESYPLVGGEPRRAPASRRRFLAAVALLVVVGLVVGVTFAVTGTKKDDASSSSSHKTPEPEEFVGMVLEPHVYAHLESLMTIANASEAVSRSVNNQYSQSAEYVEAQLAAADPTNSSFNIYRQYFKAPVWTLDSPGELSVVLRKDAGTARITLIEEHDFRVLRYSGTTNGELRNASVTFVDGSGCNKTAYASATGKLVAVTSSSTECDVYTKALLAQDAGAVAVVFVYSANTAPYLPNGRVRATEWNEKSPTVTIPAFGATLMVGDLLQEAAIGGAEAHAFFSANTTVVVSETFNIFADSKRYVFNTTLVVGAHLDSVEAGPGINDNGSGSAAILEMALQFAKRGFFTANRVRFAWFGAEELGLLGSRHYVATLDPAEKDLIKLNLNFDMLGSPNYERIVYRGDSAPADVRNLSQSAQLIFANYFEERGLAYVLEPFSTLGGSDYFPFLHAGIPAGSIATGAGSIKTMDQRAATGGTANSPYDSCYHLSCDTPLNINRAGLAEMVGAASYATMLWATVIFHPAP
eukprot:m.86668 g.86668  ORF g.86668 m.86668 type:complete len:623 (+) comp8439_c0_seq3:380-2248(+)